MTRNTDKESTNMLSQEKNTTVVGLMVRKKEKETLSSQLEINSMEHLQRE